MDESRMIRELLAEPRPPAARVTERTRARLDELATRAVPRRSRHLRIGLTAGVAAAAAVAVTAVVLPVLSGDSTPQGDPQGAVHGQQPGSTADTDPPSAKEVLLVAARREERSVAQSGRYWHVRQVSGNTDTVVGTGTNAYHVERRAVSETWTTIDAQATLWMGDRELGARPATPADEETWRRAGSPSQWDLGPGDTVGGGHVILSSSPSEGVLNEIHLADLHRPGVDLESLSPAQVIKLPTDPTTLREYLLGVHSRTNNAGEANEWLFYRAADLLIDKPAPPGVRAAALRIMAELPNVRSQGEVVDPLGRKGTGITLSRQINGGTYTHQVIVDPTSGQLLARVIGGTPAEKTKNGYVAVLDAGWTNEQPHLPSADIG